MSWGLARIPTPGVVDEQALYTQSHALIAGLDVTQAQSNKIAASPQVTALELIRIPLCFSLVWGYEGEALFSRVVLQHICLAYLRGFSVTELAERLKRECFPSPVLYLSSDY